MVQSVYLPNVNPARDQWGGRLITYLKAINAPLTVIAPHNATTASKDAAHIVLSGTADQNDINDAISSTSSSGGHVQILEGLIKLTDDIIIDKDHITLSGLRNATYIQQTAGAPRGGIVVGPSSIQQNCHIVGLTMDGNYLNTSGTAIGMKLSMSGSSVEHCDLKGYHGDNIYLQSFDYTTPGTGSAMFEIMFFNNFSRNPGGAAYHMGQTCFNSEFIRCFGVGANAFSSIVTPRGGVGFLIDGSQISLYHCHPYFFTSHGASVSSVAGHVKFVGGEYESNDGNGILSASQVMTQVLMANFYRNAGTAQLGITGGPVQIIGNSLLPATTTTTKGIEVFGATRGIVHGNDIDGTGATSLSHAISIESSSVRVTDNSSIANAGVSDILLSDSTLCKVSGNAVSKGITETGTSNSNLIQENTPVPGGAMAIATVGANTKVRRNKGYITEASSSATIASGTTVVVTHGLAATPTRIYLTMGSTGWGTAAKMWKSSVGSTTFTINIDASAGQSVTIDWIAYVGEQ